MTKSGLRRNFKKDCGRFTGFGGGVTRAGYKATLLASMVRDLNEPGFLDFVEQVSGIPKLLPDPYLEGGGLHDGHAACRRLLSR